MGGGCFWCTEAIFQRLKGVKSVTPGYSGGHVKNPTYEQVCSGETGHVEAIQIEFDSKEIPFEKILEVFFKTHDPTTSNRQGPDIGTQYKSVIFFHNRRQEKTAKELSAKLDKSGYFRGKIVTEILPFANFYKAANNHQNFYENNKAYPYCQLIIGPKLKKLYESFKTEVRV